MPYLICVPGSEIETAAAPCETIALAVAARDALWEGAWGGQALVIVDAETREVVRPCVECRGAGQIAGILCDGCKGTGRT